MDLEQFDNALRPITDGGVTSPAGFRVGAVAAGIRAGSSAPDLAVLLTEEPVPASAVFTTSSFAAAPVRVSRANLAHGGGAGLVQAVVLNAGNANAATGEAGLACARETCEIAAQILGCDPSQVLVASTGPIGVPLGIEPFDTMLPEVIDAAGPQGGADAARAIMTTDTHPKECAISYASKVLAYADRTFTVGGMCKGSGMVMPNMATLIAVITTDAPVSQSSLQRILKECVARTFNKVTVDSDSSTNDTCIMLSSGAAGADAPTIEPGTEAFEELSYVALQVCETLARQIAADGTGASKLVTVRVSGAVNADDADATARAVATSPLVKAQIAGRVCAVGPVLAALGRSGATFEQEDVDVDLMGIPACRAGVALAIDADEAARRFEAGEIVISIDLGAGEAETTIWTCDLTAGYVEHAARR